MNIWYIPSIQSEIFSINYNYTEYWCFKKFVVLFKRSIKIIYPSFLLWNYTKYSTFGFHYYYYPLPSVKDICNFCPLPVCFNFYTNIRYIVIFIKYLRHDPCNLPILLVYNMYTKGVTTVYIIIWVSMHSSKQSSSIVDIRYVFVC